MSTAIFKTDQHHSQRNSSMPACKISETRNGIDVTELRATIDNVRAHPEQGQTSWRIVSRWKGGTRSDHQVEGCNLGGQFVRRPFLLQVDEPLELGGTNQYANPQEYLLAGLNACMMVGYTAVAALMGITLTRLEVETTGDIDLRGFLGLSENVPAGYPELTQTVRIAGDADAAQFAQLHEAVQRTSPNFYNLTRSVPVVSRLQIER